MYDINKRKKMLNVTVGELIEHLQTLPKEAKVTFCGDLRGYVHVEKDDSVVTLDYSDLDEDYIEDDETAYEAYWKNRRENNE